MTSVSSKDQQGGEQRSFTGDQQQHGPAEACAERRCSDDFSDQEHEIQQPDLKFRLV
jgi:hypothetical protein